MHAELESSVKCFLSETLLLFISENNNLAGISRRKCERFLRLDNEHIFGGDQGYTLEIVDEILTTARDLELEMNEDDIEELIMEHEDELTTEELQEILNEEHQETQQNVSPSEQERGPMCRHICH
ncbi:hypothetical protein TNCV_4793591 [Trichonephila clavipes]|nr:hypothetical protein TNCV_4793591 [Trichonephila clavipes]